jgi:hypothetical protein
LWRQVFKVELIRKELGKEIVVLVVAVGKHERNAVYKNETLNDQLQLYRQNIALRL